VGTKAQLATLRKLLRESRGLYGAPAASPPAAEPDVEEGAARIERVMREVEGEGWAPQSDW
jgi:hypothetical protein